MACSGRFNSSHLPVEITKSLPTFSSSSSMSIETSAVSFSTTDPCDVRGDGSKTFARWDTNLESGFIGAASSVNRFFDIGFRLSFSCTSSGIIKARRSFSSLIDMSEAARKRGDAARKPTGRPVLTLNRFRFFIIVLKRISRSGWGVKLSMLCERWVRKEIGSRGGRRL